MAAPAGALKATTSGRLGLLVAGGSVRIVTRALPPTQQHCHSRPQATLPTAQVGIQPISDALCRSKPYAHMAASCDAPLSTDPAGVTFLAPCLSRSFPASTTPCHQVSGLVPSGCRTHNSGCCGMYTLWLISHERKIK